MYIPFFLAIFWAYDAKLRQQVRFIGGIFALDALMLVVFAGIFGWI